MRGPAYARRIKELNHPSDLARYDCLCLRENDEDIPRWRFSQGGDVKGEPRRSAVIRVTGALSSNDGTVITEWALAGNRDRRALRVGRRAAAGERQARPVTARLAPAGRPVTALLPSRTGRSARQRVFLEAATRFLSPPPWRGNA